MTPDAEDASPSPEPSAAEQDAGNMVESSVDRTVSDENTPNQSNKDNSSEPSAKKSAKDPSRPRRKKARRACFACQRAHLTCGDERPCLRCIKRGLQDHCHDGVRKKAKYLHDAPNEALMPGVAGTYPAMNGPQQGMSAGSQMGGDASSMAQSQTFYPNTIPGNYPGFGATGGAVQSPSDPAMVGQFNNQQASMPSTRYSVDSSQQVSPMQASMTSMDTPVENQQNPQFTAPFDPTDPSFFNFDVSGLNFSNNYGALEFGMLGHMSSGAVGTPDVDSSGLMNPMSFDASGNNNFNTSPAAFPYNANANTFSQWQPGNGNTGSRQGSAGNLYPMDNSNNFDQSSNYPNAFAIGENNASLSGASPSTNGLDFAIGYNSSPNATGSLYPNQHQQPHQQHDYNQIPHHRQRGQFPASSDIQAQQNGARKRRRDPSQIYSSVNKPYSYTTGFHSLTAFIQKRFSPQKTLRIAKALASIRPSFISCTKQLNTDDLIFMEKCFQRTLWEYEDFINSYGTPTVICRRTGEVAAVSKEFSLLTGWRRDVLLGKEPNLNVNTGGTSGNLTGTSSRGAATPRVPASNVDATQGRPQPVFLAELLDDDSVIQFYEDFAKLAFGDPRGYAITPCKLLKYRTKEDPGWGEEGVKSELDVKGGNINAKVRNGGLGGGEPGGPLISGEQGMNALGEKDGKVACMYCWSVKRDVFDIPMLIVMNFLPII